MFENWFKRQKWWYSPIIPALRQEDCKFETSLGNIARHCLKKRPCNSSYSGGRDQEDCNSKSARENNL
jgi:hypothetical protein